MLRRIQHCTEAIYFKLNLYLNWQFHFEWEKEVPFVRWSEAEGTNFTPLKSKPTYLQYIHNGVNSISKSYSNSCTITILQITQVQSNLAIRNGLIRNKLVLRNHFLWPICHLLHKDKELLALRNNFRATKRFLIAKFDFTHQSRWKFSLADIKKKNFDWANLIPILWGKYGTVELGNKELFGHPKIVPLCQKFLILMK